MSSWLHRACALVCLCLASVAPAWAVAEADLLPVDDAFALTASATDRGHVALDWRIAEGYYLYRQRISVQSPDGSFHTAALQLPTGEKHHDEFFGQVETYRHRLQAVQTGAAAHGIDTVTLKVKYQGCADAGVCYPPQTRVLQVALSNGAGNAADTGGLAALGRALAGNAARSPGLAGLSSEPLPPEQAFGFEAIVGDGNTLLLRFTPARGYYLYRDKTTLRLETEHGDRDAGIALASPRWPPGVMHRDEHFGNVVVYFDQADVSVPLRRTRIGAARLTLRASFQGCQTDGICYPPMTRMVGLVIPPGQLTPINPAGVDSPATENPDPLAPAIANAIAPADGSAPSAPSPPASVVVADAAATGVPALAEDDRLAAALAGHSRWLALLGFFGAGLLLAFTPCVLPMIPILSGLIAGQGTRLGTRRALLLSLVYVVANALVFTAAGVVAGLLGANLQAAFQTPWIIVAFAALFVVLALSSFGLFELQLPHALRSRLGAVTDRQRGGSLAGVAAMGALSALIVGPCVAPPLAAAVLYISQSHDPWFGGAALFLLAMGMGVPLLAFGAAAGRGMPTSGPWMTAAQRVFGLVFLALAVWMLARILPPGVTLALWGALGLAAAAWAFSASGASPRTRVLARFVGLLLAVVGAAELLGALGGGRDPLQPLAGVLGAPATPSVHFRRLKSSADLDRELAAAQAAGKPLLLDFYADWCVSCKEMEKYTFSDPAVQRPLAGFVLVQADVTANDAVDQTLMRRLGIIGPPATLFFADGSERRALRLVGYEKAPAFVARLQRATP